MAVTALMFCKGTSENEDAEGGTIVLEVVTSGSAEAEQYFKYTPYGGLNLGTLNPAAYNQFEEGKRYKVTIEEYDDGSVKTE